MWHGNLKGAVPCYVGKYAEATWLILWDSSSVFRKIPCSIRERDDLNTFHFSPSLSSVISLLFENDNMDKKYIIKR